MSKTGERLLDSALEAGAIARGDNKLRPDDAQMVIKATFADWRPVKSRKQLQLIFEVPLENTGIVLKMLGTPMPDRETWCAIALLDKTHDAISLPYTLPYIEPAPRIAFCDLPFSQQAGIKSNDEKFQHWMIGLHSTAGCAAAIRNHCGVESRAKILPGTEAGDRWLGLLRDFEGVR
jgi:hypothetical protein